MTVCCRTVGLQTENCSSLDDKLTMQSIARNALIIYLQWTLTATLSEATEDALNSVPSSRSKISSSALNKKDVRVGDSDKEWYHWVVTRHGDLASGVSTVDDPDELSHYSEYDVTIKQRRKRKLSDDDVTGLALNTSAPQGSDNS